MEELELYLSDADDRMKKAVKHVEAELAKLRAGKAHPSMLEGIKVDYYGSMMPINQVANVNTPDPKCIVIIPWEKNMLSIIEKAIKDSNLGLNPIKEADLIRLSLPPLTEERRKVFVKQAHNEAENGKVAIRS